MKIIGISGYVGSGKDTTAEVLTGMLAGSYVNSFGSPIRRLSELLGYPTDRHGKEYPKVRVFRDFDDALITGLRDILPTRVFAQSHIFCYIKEALTDGGFLTTTDYGYDRLFISPRRLMQIIGQAGREMDQDFWVRYFERAAKDCAYAIASDVRMPNEADVCDYIIFIDRPGTGVVNNAASEQHYLDIRKQANCVIDNGGDLCRLFNQVHAIAKELS